MLIHEGRFTYASKGLVCLADLGELWERQMRSPLPLGAIAVRRSSGSVRRVMRLAGVAHLFAHDQAGTHDTGSAAAG